MKAFAWPSVKARVTVDGVVTVVDASAVAEGRVASDEAKLAEQRAKDLSLEHDDPVEELFEDQLRCADLIVDLQDRPRRRGGARARGQGDRRGPAARRRAPSASPTASSPPTSCSASPPPRKPTADNRKSHHELAGEEHDHDDFDTFVLDVTRRRSRGARERASKARWRSTACCASRGSSRSTDAPRRSPCRRSGRAWRRGSCRTRTRKPGLVVIGLKGLDRATGAGGARQKVPRSGRRAQRARIASLPGMRTFLEGPAARCTLKAAGVTGASRSISSNRPATSSSSPPPTRRFPALPRRGARSAKTFPSVRLANWMALAHPYSVDLYGEKVLAHAKLVVAPPARRRVLLALRARRGGAARARQLQQARRHPRRRDLGCGARGARNGAGGGGAKALGLSRRGRIGESRQCLALLRSSDRRRAEPEEARRCRARDDWRPLPEGRWRGAAGEGELAMPRAASPHPSLRGHLLPQGEGARSRPPRSSSTARWCRPGRPSRSMRFARRLRSAG